MHQERLPDGFQLAEDLPPRRPVEITRHEAPRRQPQPGDPKVWTLGDALQRFRLKVPSAAKKDNINLGGARVGVVFEVDEDKFLVLYKREKYRFFSRHFPNAPGDGEGITANLKMVHWAAVEGMKFATVFPDGSCYSLDAMEFWNFYEKYGTDVKSLPGEISCPFEIWAKVF